MKNVSENLEDDKGLRTFARLFREGAGEGKKDFIFHSTYDKKLRFIALVINYLVSLQLYWR
jgi:hypothetical protein